MTLGVALLTIFLLVFCLLGILPVLYVYTSYSVGALFPRVCCVLCSVKHRRGEVLLAGFVWQPRFAGPNTKFVRVTGESISVSTEEKKVCVGFQRSVALFLLDESLTSCGSLLLMWSLIVCVHHRGGWGPTYRLGSRCCARCSVIGAKKILRRGLQCTARVIPTPKPQPHRGTLVSFPKKEIAKQAGLEG